MDLITLPGMMGACAFAGDCFRVCGVGGPLGVRLVRLIRWNLPQQERRRRQSTNRKHAAVLSQPLHIDPHQQKTAAARWATRSGATASSRRTATGWSPCTTKTGRQHACWTPAWMACTRGGSSSRGSSSRGSTSGSSSMQEVSMQLVSMQVVHQQGLRCWPLRSRQRWREGDAGLVGAAAQVGAGGGEGREGKGGEGICLLKRARLCFVCLSSWGAAKCRVGRSKTAQKMARRSAADAEHHCAKAIPLHPSHSNKTYRTPFILLSDLTESRGGCFVARGAAIEHHASSVVI